MGFVPDGRTGPGHFSQYCFYSKGFVFSEAVSNHLDVWRAILLVLYALSESVLFIWISLSFGLHVGMIKAAVVFSFPKVED